jgi:hypothetical protein
MVSPLQQRTAGLSQAFDRSVLVHVPAEVPSRGAPERSTHAFSRRQQLRVQPCPEDLVKNAIRLALGQDDEQRIDAGFHGPLAQQVGTQRVNRADVRLFQVSERVLEGGQRRGIARFGRLAAFLFDFFTQPQLQLPGRFLGERHRDNVGDVHARGDDPENPPDERGRLAGAGSRLDDLRLVEGAWIRSRAS